MNQSFIQKQVVLPVHHEMVIDLCEFNISAYSDAEYTKLPYPMPIELKKGANKRKGEFLAGRLCAANALSRLGFSQVVDIESDRSPKWPHQAIGSISHSNSLAIAIAEPERNLRAIGIDCEHIIDEVTAANINTKILTKAELKQEQDKLDPVLVTRYFSAKESVYKCLFPMVKQYFDFQDVSISFSEKEQTFVARLNRDISADINKGYALKGFFTFYHSHVLTTAYILQTG